MLKTIREIGVPFVALFFIYLLNPYGLNIYVGYLIAALILLQKSFLVKNVDAGFWLLFVFSVIYAAFFSFDPIAGKQYIVIYAVVPGSFYLLGKFFVRKFSQNTDKIFLILLISSVVFSSTGILSVGTVISDSGFVEVDRNLPNFWTGQITPATKMGAFFTLIMCIPALILARTVKVNLIARIILLGLFAISVLCVLRIGSRTQLGVFIITFLVSLIYLIPRQKFKRNMVIFSLIFMSIFYVSTKVSFDLDQDWLAAYANRMEDSEDFASGGGRTDRWMKSMEYLFTKPLGWSEHEFGHAHNLWFDVLRIGGFISFFSLIFFTIYSFKTVFTAISKDKTKTSFNNQLIVYTIAFTLVFTVEPILEGTFDFFALFCFFIGVVKKYSADNPVIE
ncbi:hypothetical protein [Allomuricauda sp.]|uniref:O-antigen ligase family protein n=1 Tax=Flagellimonas alginolytica TaxID=3177515 RepID=UPI0025FF7F54|nr:hypothetical protein [Allomuricauda sp.]